MHTPPLLQTPQAAAAPAAPAAADPGPGAGVAAASWHSLLLPYTQRTQLAVLQSDLAPLSSEVSKAGMLASARDRDAANAATPLVTGMEGLGDGAARLRFGRDSRLDEVGWGRCRAGLWCA
jgi:hypothetical protein